MSPFFYCLFFTIVNIMLKWLSQMCVLLFTFLPQNDICLLLVVHAWVEWLFLIYLMTFHQNIVANVHNSHTVNHSCTDMWTLLNDIRIIFCHYNLNCECSLCSKQKLKGSLMLVRYHLNITRKRIMETLSSFACGNQINRAFYICFTQMFTFGIINDWNE